MKKTLLTIPVAILFPKLALAHCPLCTVGAGALAILATSLGISSVVVGVLIGGFAVALSSWLSKLPKKEYLPYQPQIIWLVIFLGTIIPIMPLIRDYGPLYVKILGEYGTLFHNTYTVNLFLAGTLLGSVLMFLAHPISKFITRTRKQTLPYQGLSIAILLLVVASVVVELLS
ncbi:MAG: hypothetical protein AAB719_00920 [Patescibacteria group bacterium]